MFSNCLFALCAEQSVDFYLVQIIQLWHTFIFFSDVNVQIFILDENDHDPVFEESYYRVNIPEDTSSGTEVLTILAQDKDGSSPFNEIVYRITSGAKDKFIIEPDTGKILVSRGANLDPDLTVPTSNSYLLEITAFDQAVGDRKRFGRTHVNVTIGMIIFISINIS